MKSVRVVCSQQKIRLRRGRRLMSGPIEQPAEHAGAVPDRMVVVYMPAPLYTAFNRKAAHLDKPVPILASMLLNAIRVTSDIYNAVLDD
jgi:hypothetical protein